MVEARVSICGGVIVLLLCGSHFAHARPDGSGLSETSPETREAGEGHAAHRGRNRTENLRATHHGCGSGCEVCHEDHCFVCSNGYRRIDYSCTKEGCTDKRCLDCSADVCYKCIDGYAPDLEGLCAWIGPTGCQEENCMLCEETRLGCTECMPGFQLRSNRCLKNVCADKNCMRCSADGQQCMRCKEGFQSRMGECLEMGCLDDRCRNCSPSGGSCYRCDPGYSADPDTDMCKTCPDPNCINCNGSQQSCIKCVEGFFAAMLSSGRVGCVECGEAKENCMTCSRDGDDCYSCSTGYYLEHGHCIACPPDCATCKSPWLCDVCKEGYDLYANGLCQMGRELALASSDADRQSPLRALFLFVFVDLLLFACLL